MSTVQVTFTFPDAAAAAAFLTQGAKPAPAASKQAPVAKNELGDPEGTVYYTTPDEKLFKVLPGEPAPEAGKAMKIGIPMYKAALEAAKSAGTPSTAASTSAPAASSADPFGDIPTTRTATADQVTAKLREIFGSPGGSNTIATLQTKYNVPGMQSLVKDRTPEFLGALLTEIGG